MSLRSKLIRLAHQNPELRPHLLPFLKEAGLWGSANVARQEALVASREALNTSSEATSMVTETFLDVYDKVTELTMDFPIPHVALETAIEKARKGKEDLLKASQDYSDAIKNLIPLLKG